MATYNDIINGLKLFAEKQEDGEEEQLGGADHDIIFGPSSDMLVCDFTDEEEEQLDMWGWFFSEEHDCWAHFV